MAKLIDFETHKDQRGILTVSEKHGFSIKRAYWIYGTKNVRRGGHRHKKNEQILIAIVGTVRVYWSDGKAAETIVLNTPEKGLYLKPKDWHTMEISEDGVLLVLASEEYDLQDYIDKPY